MSDVKSRIIAEWKRTAGSSRQVATALGVSYDYVAFILRTERGEGPPTSFERVEGADDDHVGSVLAAGGYRAFDLQPAYRLRSHA